MKKLLLILLIGAVQIVTAQNKKPLDHSVYDGWKSIGERLISNDGNFIAYTVNPQEGDGELVIQSPALQYKKTIARGYNAVITEDSRYLICKIKPAFQDTRQAKIKKKTGDEIPKDSLAIIELGKDSVYKSAKVKSFKTPEKGTGWVAWLNEKAEIPTSKVKAVPDSLTQLNNLLRMADSLVKVADSLRNKTNEAKLNGLATLNPKKETKPTVNRAEPEKIEEGTELILRNLVTGTDKKIKLVTGYYFSKYANSLIVTASAKNGDSLSKASIIWIDLASGKADTILKKYNDAKNFALNEDGNKLAFVAERDSVSKALTKFYKLYYYQKGNDTAAVIAEKNTVGMQLGYTVSENANISFSKDGKQLYFGTNPIKAPKDTSLVDFELAKLDVWHYKDDYLQPQQLKQVEQELKRSYLAVIRPGEKKMIQLGTEEADNISLVNEGNAHWVLAESNKGNRIESQWQGNTRSSAWVISTLDGTKKSVANNLIANFNPSPAGKYVYWYDDEKRNYYVYDVFSEKTRAISDKLKVLIYDEENDVPDYPNAYGLMGWSSGDSAAYMYDRYDIWKLDPAAINAPVNIIGTGRTSKITTRYIPTDREQRFFQDNQTIYFRQFNNINKATSIASAVLLNKLTFEQLDGGNFSFPYFAKAKKNSTILYSKEDAIHSPNLYVSNRVGEKLSQAIQLSDINPQQAQYNWMTAELFSWKAYNGKMTQGIVYKPENFDPTKKYPLICYFYEKLSDGLNTYQAPAPTPSRLNIPFFVSRGYIVLAPDIYYTKGHPGNDAYNYIVSGARALVKKGFIDSTKMGLQGQSWGGYQTAYIITRTKLFAAAWAGAPVANMTSAYGGIRWESGLNRQFQYEHTQSRIGATLWEKTNLYLENSPLFSLPKVSTPVVIMSNDADGAVPWYQGIEMFTGLRRLGKPSWLLNYNGEAHNLVERRNRKDIQIREQQFFDWLLKGEKPAKWLTDGVPATQKGIDWGL